VNGNVLTVERGPSKWNASKIPPSKHASGASVTSVQVENKWFNPARIATLRARAAEKFIASLLEGSPVKRQVIAERIQPAEAERRSREAISRLKKAEKPGKVSELASGGGEPERKPKQEKETKAKKETKAEAIISSNKQKQSAKHEDAMRTRLKEKLRIPGVKERVSELLKFACECRVEKSDKPAQHGVAAEAMLLALAELAAAGEAKEGFVLIQQVLRAGVEHLSADAAAQLSTAARKLGFRDLSTAIEAVPLTATAADDAKKDGKKKKKADASAKDADAGKAVATSIRFQLQRNPENLARPIGQPDPRVQFRPDDWQVSLPSPFCTSPIPTLKLRLMTFSFQS
jgi:hypothetical protein